MSRLLLGAAAYIVPTFGIGFVWHLIVFDDVYRDLQVYRTDLIIPFGVAAMTIQGLTYSAAYSRLLGGSSVVAGTIWFGASAGVLAWGYGVLAVAAKHPMTSVPVFVGIETAFTLVQFAVVSPLLAFVWRTVPSNVES
ncbi:MAG: hypothetical protein KBA31_14630 [Alphaproteobacteria bacterium]|nr:hypothetical protein [Alphaproteobacteria bacterium]